MPARLGLEVLEIAARGDFPVRVLAGQPRLEVVCLRRGEPEVARAEADCPVMDPQLLQYLFGIERQFLKLVIGGLGRRELHHFNLVELVLPDEAPRVLAVRARLRPEAGRICNVIYREVLFVEDLILRGYL